MPIYEFRCLGCGHVFELLKLKKEDEGLEMKCPKCGSHESEKVLSTMNVAVAEAVPVLHSRFQGPRDDQMPETYDRRSRRRYGKNRD
jgi:putative FmdB family regulatory protein